MTKKKTLLHWREILALGEPLELFKVLWQALLLRDLNLDVSQLYKTQEIRFQN
jgi:hypothetical protein